MEKQVLRAQLWVVKHQMCTVCTQWALQALFTMTPCVHYDPYVHYDPCVPRCICQPGYEGRNCEVNINECADLPCRNGSTCIDLINDFRWDHRRRIKTEEKAKVVATAWGMIQFLATLAVFPKDDLKKGWLDKGYLVEWMLWKNE